jgi:bifunctional DNA-binding transcriptional regulator/antitoxin component of YhaV-PrlF toxin-antitoxin module
MVNITRVKIDSKGRIQLPSSFLTANNLKHGEILTIKPMVNKKNSVALVWEEK